MTWTLQRAKDRNPHLTDALTQPWVDTANPALTQCLPNGGPQADDEGQAVELVDGAVKNARNSRVAADEYATFKRLYGIDIAKDLDQNARPVGPVFDAGAYEYTPGVYK